MSAWSEAILFIIVYIFLLWARVDIGRLSMRTRHLDSRMGKFETELEEVKTKLAPSR